MPLFFFFYRLFLTSEKISGGENRAKSKNDKRIKRLPF